ncbi:MAG: N-acetylmuramoyl-L-alanine amidase [Anaerosolibacter sp.]|jgi:N-acetylmuramoyl-L-alanine amidase|uniref:N-acetylmuramoyl-L-alanine amidase family protein n=1 Tax=Anaerosolibacter sp. TaxID=1872527 RepID=UPI00263514E3|nr:N-acetylmuramoyl-L-alanine amidase [Anaerosolibacter sp.]MDF2547219.1 N-acetylmuramoyl-L-alanine amidase [Anaerosolibacter sp.]
MARKIILIHVNFRIVAVLSFVLILLIGSLLLNNHFEFIQTLSNMAYTHTVVIDPGHGGIDCGTSQGDVLEKDLNLRLALRIKTLLQKQKVKVILTRSKDISLEDQSHLTATRYKRDLDARKNIINNSSPDLFVSIHTDARPDEPTACGIGIFYFPRSQNSKRIAENVHKTIEEIIYKNHLGQTEKIIPIAPGDYYILRETKPPGILIETGFLTNSKDFYRLQNEAYQAQLALAISKGIIYALRNSY